MRGAFSVESDRATLHALMGELLEARLAQLARGGRAALGEWRFLRALAPHLGAVPAVGSGHSGGGASLETSLADWLAAFRFESATQVDERGWGPLMIASIEANVTMIDALVAAGADPNRSTTKAYPRALCAKGMTPLMWMIAARYVPDGEACAAAMQCLLHHGARLGVTDALKQTALHYWAEMGVEGVVACHVLLGAGADTSAVDAIGQPPLLAAANTCTMNFAVVDTLVSSGCDVNVTSPGNNSNLPMLCTLGGSLTAERLEQTQAAAVPLDQKFFPSLQGSRLARGLVRSVFVLTRQPNLKLWLAMVGGTALHECARNGYVRTAELLLAAGADPTIRDAYGKSAVDIARDATDAEERGGALAVAMLDVLSRAERELEQRGRPHPAARGRLRRWLGESW